MFLVLRDTNELVLCDRPPKPSPPPFKKRRNSPVAETQGADSTCAPQSELNFYLHPKKTLVSPPLLCESLTATSQTFASICSTLICIRHTGEDSSPIKRVRLHNPSGQPAGSCRPSESMLQCFRFWHARIYTCANKI